MQKIRVCAKGAKRLKRMPHKQILLWWANYTTFTKINSKLDENLFTDTLKI